MRASALLLSLLLTYPAVTDTETAGAGTPTPRAPNDGGKAQTVFNVKSGRLPAEFEGNTVEWVLANGAVVPRFTFESDSDYDARVAKFKPEIYAFVPDRRAFSYFLKGNTVAVRVYPSTTNVVSKKSAYFRSFDVNRTKLRTVSSVFVTPIVGDKPHRGVLRPPPLEGTYVETSEWKQTQIVLDESETTLGISRGPLAVELTVTPEQTKRINRNLALALLCVPEFEQYRASGNDLVPEATGTGLERPASRTSDTLRIYYVALRVQLLQIWVFDRVTGEIYGRFMSDGTPIQNTTQNQ